MTDWRTHPWGGVFAATLCPFLDDESVDEAGLTDYIGELAAAPGIQGVVCNGHTGEIMSLRPNERAEVTRIVAKAARAGERRVKTVSGVSAEGSLEAIDHALAAKEAGANAIMLMPPHHWLRFGRSMETAVGFFQDVAEGADLPMIVHQYPAWTKAGYSLDEMLEFIKLPRVVSIKMGTRDMARWLYDYEKLKEASPETTIITCHDEFLLPTLLEAADGALIGFAGFAPELMVELVHAALDGDLARAKKAQQTVAPLARIIYGLRRTGLWRASTDENRALVVRQVSQPSFSPAGEAIGGRESGAHTRAVGGHQLFMCSLVMRGCQQVLFLLLLLATPVVGEEKPAQAAGSERGRHALETFPSRGARTDLSIPPRTPEETVRSFQLMKGLTAEVVLAEPHVTQPVFLTFDERGRLWVVQFLQYPYPAGLKIVDVDNQFHAVYDRTPPAPPKHDRGADRITIHEDTDGDGLFDLHKTFLEGMNMDDGRAAGTRRRLRSASALPVVLSGCRSR